MQAEMCRRAEPPVVLSFCGRLPVKRESGFSHGDNGVLSRLRARAPQGIFNHINILKKSQLPQALMLCTTTMIPSSTAIVKPHKYVPATPLGCRLDSP